MRLGAYAPNPLYATILKFYIYIISVNKEERICPR